MKKTIKKIVIFMIVIIIGLINIKSNATENDGYTVKQACDNYNIEMGEIAQALYDSDATYTKDRWKQIAQYYYDNNDNGTMIKIYINDNEIKAIQQFTNQSDNAQSAVLNLIDNNQNNNNSNSNVNEKKTETWNISAAIKVCNISKDDIINKLTEQNLGVSQSKWEDIIEMYKLNKNAIEITTITNDNGKTYSLVNVKCYLSSEELKKSKNNETIENPSIFGNKNETGNTLGNAGNGSTSMDFSTMKNQADSFIDIGSQGQQITINEAVTSLIPIGKVLVGIATVVLVIVGTILGVKYMMAGANEKANLKEKLIWYVISIVLVFGAVGIYNIIVNLIQNVLS